MLDSGWRRGKPDRMAAGITIAVLGIVAMFTGGRITSVRIRQAHGADIFASKQQTHATAGTGIVPPWVSLLTLAGWVLLAIGIVVVMVAALSD